MLRESNIEVRFAVGEVPKEYERQVAEEEDKFGAFLHIPVKVGAAPSGKQLCSVLKLLGQNAPTLFLGCRTVTRRFLSKSWGCGSWCLNSTT